MSKKVKALIERDIKNRVGTPGGVAVVNPINLDGNKNNALRGKLRKSGARMTVVKNTLARRALQPALGGFEKLLDGPSALIYPEGDASLTAIARLLLDEKKDNDKLELRGIFFDGEVYAGEAGVEQVSKLPTREEAIAGILGSLLGPGGSLLGALQGPGGTLGALLTAIEDKAKEKEAAPAA